MMQQFSLIHDGTDQGWQTTYLALHIAAELGARLQVLLLGSLADEKILAQRASHVEVGGHAAGVAIDTILLTDPWPEVAKTHITSPDGLFVSRRFIPDAKTATHFLETLACPLWVISRETEIRKIAVLVKNPKTEESLIHFSEMLSRRLQRPLVGLIERRRLSSISTAGSTFPWEPLASLRSAKVNAKLQELDAGLTSVSAWGISLLTQLPHNYIIFPAERNA